MSRDRWKLTVEEYEFIKGEAVNILVQYNINCIPISGFEIATKIGLKIIPYSALSRTQLEEIYEENEDGLLRIDKKGIGWIYYNDIDMKYERINMTLLHEIGHYVLDHTGDKDKWEHEEAEANFFAKYIISPPVLVDMIGAESADDIYQTFDISMEAAWYNYEYYINWSRKVYACGRLTEYEKKLVALFESQRKEAICER